MGIVRDLYMARKIGAGLKLPAPTLARLIKRMGYAPKHTPQTYGPDDIVEFTANMERKVKSLVVDISNADGLTGLTVYRHGKNYLRPTYNEGEKTVSSVKFSPQDDGSVVVKGTASGTAAYSLYAPDATMFLPNGTYIFSLGSDNNAKSPYARIGSGDGSTHDVSAGNYYELTVTGNKFRCTLRGSSGNEYDCTLYPMIRLSTESDDTYEPYTGDTYTDDWTDEAGSITSGTLNVISGELTTGGNTYQLTPQEVKTLVGQNHVWSNAGDVTVTA